MKYITLFPFGYTWATRARTSRDLLYLAITQVVPGIWIVHKITNEASPDALLSYLLGYIAFIAVYELGYLANDLWDARRDVGGRLRTPFHADPPWLTLFIGVRGGVWAGILCFLPPTDPLSWLAGFAALICVFIMHNVFQLPSIRVATFTQLCLLRYFLPITYSTGVVRAFDIFIIAFLLYFPFRYLGYLDSKEWLRLSDRRLRTFGAYYLAAIMPLSFFVTIFASDLLLWEVYTFSLGSQGLFLSFTIVFKVFIPSKSKQS